MLIRIIIMLNLGIMFQLMEEKKTNIDALQWAIEGEKNGAGNFVNFYEC